MIAHDLVSDAAQLLRWRLVLLVSFMLLSGALEGLGLSMLFPILARFGVGHSGEGALQQVVDRALAAMGIPDDLGVLLAVTVTVLLLQVLFQTVRAWMEADCQTRYTEFWQRRLFAAFIGAEWRFLTEGTAASRVNAIVNEAARVNSAFYLYVQMATAAIFITVYAAIAVAASWQLVAFIAAFGAITYWVMRPLSLRASRIGERLGKVNEAVQHRASEFLHSAKLIKVTGSEDLAQEQYNAAVRDFRLSYRQASFHPKLVLALYMAVGYAMLGFGLWGAISHLKVGPASILVSVYVSLRLYVQVTNFQQLRHGFLVSIPAFRTLRQEVAAAEAVAERLHEGDNLPAGPADIVLDSVSVDYGTTRALDAVSLHIGRGEVLGITGPSGAGKSTLVDVIAGLVRGSEGTVRIDGIPIDAVALHDWRKSIGYVGQETVLLNASIRTNIAWGNRADDSDIERAASAANIHDFIMSLPAGYQTEVGDRGVRLSGGQRQRLGLARALVGTKRLLILDEATSALDSESEQAIARAIAALHGSVSILIVAHRLSTLRDTTRIVVLECGQVVDVGPFNELTKRNGAFARLWRLQQGTAADA